MLNAVEVVGQAEEQRGSSRDRRFHYDTFLYIDSRMLLHCAHALVQNYEWMADTFRLRNLRITPVSFKEALYVVDQKVWKSNPATDHPTAAHANGSTATLERLRDNGAAESLIGHTGPLKLMVDEHSSGMVMAPA